MTTNFPGPYEVRLFYSVNVTGAGGVLQHEQRLNVQCASDPSVGTAFSAITLVNGYGHNLDLQAVVDAWVAICKPLHNSGSATFDYAELWKYTPGTFLSSFVSSYTVGVGGTSGSSVVPASQSIYTFRSTEGGILKISLLDTVEAVNALPKTYAGLSALEKAVADFVLDDVPVGYTYGNFFLARDTSYPFGFNRLFNGQNEKVFKKRYRN